MVFFLIAPGASSPAEPPGFIYGIVFSLFIFFNSCAVVQLLLYRAKGGWANYLYGEKASIVWVWWPSAARLTGVRRYVGQVGRCGRTCAPVSHTNGMSGRIAADA